MNNGNNQNMQEFNYVSNPEMSIEFSPEEMNEVITSEVVFLNFKSNCSLLIYRELINFCISTLYL